MALLPDPGALRLAPPPRPVAPGGATDDYTLLGDGSAAAADMERPPLPGTLATPPETRTHQPIIIRRRAQQGPAPPPAASAASSAPRADGWDRSPAARRSGLERFGGTPRTENAVEAGLAWLAAHQAPDGTWDRVGFSAACPAEDRCGGAPTKRLDDDLTAGVTGLALLAFLGAGYTDRTGPYQPAVARAVAALLASQQEHGGFSVGESMAGYNDALATFALAEYLVLTGAAQVRAPLELAAARLAASQQALGGWDYGRFAQSARNDTSITAWAVQALHACAAAGVELPTEVLVRAALHFTRATEPDGRVRYADAGSGFRLDDRMRPVYRHGPALLAAGLTCEQLLGWRLDGPLVLAQRARVLNDLPSTAKARGRDTTQLHNEYYWYYGTLAMFQRGGDDWDRWNAHLRDALLPLQVRSESAAGVRPHAWGSWPPFGPSWGMFGRMGGRVYATAISTLTLEVYYRHTPAFLTEDIVFRADDWSAALAGRPERERLEAVSCLRSLRLEVGEPPLLVLLGDPESRVGLAAAEALAELDSPVGLPAIERVITTQPPWERQNLGRAVARIRAVLALPPVTGRVRRWDAASGLTTVELPRSFAGMRLRVLRDERPIAVLRVIQRFTNREVAVTEFLADESREPPQSGDQVREERSAVPQ